jgi:hypothetical protein
VDECFSCSAESEDTFAAAAFRGSLTIVRRDAAAVAMIVRRNISGFVCLLVVLSTSFLQNVFV